MKELKKDNNGYFVCEECASRSFRTLSALTMHIRHSHNAQYKQYFDNWIKEPEEGICKICGKSAIFSNIDYGYRSGCCKDHMNKWNQIQIKKAVKEKYGVDNIFQLEETKNKSKETCLLNNGCEYSHQNIIILEKALKTGHKVAKFKNTDIWYQGSYELDFLEKYYDKIPGIKRAPSIKYQLNGIDKVYFPDFYVPSANLIIECKSTYWYKAHKNKVDIKKKAVISNGFNFCMILDKDYSSLYANIASFFTD